MKIRLEIPKDAVLTAKVGSKLKFDDPFFSREKTEKISINVSSELQIKGDKLFHHLTKVIGETVTKGEVMAVKKGVFGSKKVRSSGNGTIAEINHMTGDVIIELSESSPETQGESQSAFFSGKIDAFDNQTKVVTVVIDDAIEIGLKSVSESGGGEMYFFSDEGHYFTATEDQIQNEIIIVSDLKSHITAKCEALGARGFIYLSTRPDLHVGGAQAEKIADFETLVKSKKKYILYSALDKKALIYD